MSKDIPFTITGNIGSDPEIKFFESGSVANFSIAGRESKKEGGEWVEAESSWLDCKAFGKLGENVCESLPKGTRVVATGFIRQERWEKDGDKRSKIVGVVESIGPDLRWATASVTKNEKGTGGGSATSGGQTSKPAVENPYA